MGLRGWEVVVFVSSRLMHDGCEVLFLSAREQPVILQMAPYIGLEFCLLLTVLES
jgi:hypothetical protein